METGPGRGLRFGAGVFGGLAAGLTVIGIKLATGAVTLADVLVDRLLFLVPIDLFSLGVRLLEGWAKVVFYIAVLFLLAGAGGLAGLALGPVSPVAGVLGAGVGGWVLLGVVVLPLLGAGLFGAGLTGGPVVVGLGLLATCLAYGLGLSLAWRLVGAAAEAGFDPGRRRLLAGLGAGAVLVAAGGVLLRLLNPAGSQGGGLAVPLTPEEALPPEITPNDQFYIVSKNIVDPTVDLSRWRLEVRGLVDRPLTLTYDEVRRLPAREEIVTFECISNEVGGDLISTARWRGVPLAYLLDQAGLRPGARKVVIRAWDDYSTAIPVEKATHPDTILAYEMNGETLPHKHGFPLRLVAPGLYGMKNPKWVTAIEAVDYDYLGFWEQRGWSDRAVIKTMSEIIVPSRTLAVRSPGPVRLGGVAFGGDRGIVRVELSFDGGQTWRQAELRPALSPYSWVLWTAEWNPPPGSYRVVVRAVDGSGEVQDPTPRPPLPDGATGYHVITVRVREV